jgi:hypothetical protein
MALTPCGSGPVDFILFPRQANRNRNAARMTAISLADADSGAAPRSGFLPERSRDLMTAQRGGTVRACW